MVARGHQPAHSTAPTIGTSAHHRTGQRSSRIRSSEATYPANRCGVVARSMLRENSAGPEPASAPPAYAAETRPPLWCRFGSATSSRTSSQVNSQPAAARVAPAATTCSTRIISSTGHFPIRLDGSTRLSDVSRRGTLPSTTRPPMAGPFGARYN